MSSQNPPIILLTGTSSFLVDQITSKLSKDYKFLTISKKELHLITKEKDHFLRFKKKLLNKSIYGIIHLASQKNNNSFLNTNITKSNLYFFNVEITKSIAKLGVLLNVERFIFASTTDVYGIGDLDFKKTIDTFSPTNPQNYFAASKLSAEYSLQSIYSKEPQKLVILRMAPFLISNNDIHLRLLNFFANKKIPFPVLKLSNNPSSRRSFTYPNYFCWFVLNVLKKEIPSGEIYNLHSKKHSIIDLLNIFYKKESKPLYFILGMNRFIAKIFLKIPFVKQIIYPFILNHNIIKNRFNTYFESHHKY